VGRTHVEEVCGELLPWERPHAGAGNRVRSPPSVEEGAAETASDELTTIPIPHLPVPLGGRR